MFNFNNKELDTFEKSNGSLRMATSADIKKYVNSYDMFRFYIGDFTLGKPFLSPIREERVPSFSIFVTTNNEVVYNDFLLGGGGIIKFVMKRFNLSFTEAMNKIIQDAGLTNKFRSGLNYTPKALIKHDKTIKHRKPIIKVKSRKWCVYDTQFWENYHITKATLKKYRVSPISNVFIDYKIIVAEKYAYVFKEFKDNKKSLTIYQPYSEMFKWMKSHDASVFYGWSQLPEKGDRLIITKSLKDVMTIDSITGIPTVALQNEKIKPKEQVIQELKGRFKEIYLFYDNDYNKETNYGREFGKDIAKEFNLSQIEIPDFFANNYDAKDISDLAKNAGEEYVKVMLTTDIKNYII